MVDVFFKIRYVIDDWRNPDTCELSNTKWVVLVAETLQTEQELRG